MGLNQADRFGRNRNRMNTTMIRNVMLFCGLVTALGISTDSFACQRCRPGQAVCYQPGGRVAGYNPYGSTYGRMLSYTEALSRAEDANRAEAALAKSEENVNQLTDEVAALKQHMAELEQQLANTKQAHEKSEQQRKVAVQKNEELSQQLKQSRETAEQHQQNAEKLKVSLDAEQKKLAAETEARQKEVKAREEAQALAKKIAAERDEAQAVAKSTQDEVARLRTENAKQAETVQQQRVRIETLEKAAMKPEEPKVQSEEAPKSETDGDKTEKSPTEDKDNADL